MRHNGLYFKIDTKRGVRKNLGVILPGECWNPTGKNGIEKDPNVAVHKFGGLIKYYADKTKGVYMKSTVRKQKRTRVEVSIVKEAREIQDIARRSAPEALKALDTILKSEVASDMAKIAAANTILDRGYGKSTQVNVNASVNTDGKPQEIDGKELDKRIISTLNRVEAITGRKREKIQSEERPADVRVLN